MIRYAWRDLLRNPRRTLAALVGVSLGVGLFASVLFFIDGSAATMTARAIAPVPLDVQRIITASPDALTLTERIEGPTSPGAGDRVHVTLVVRNDGSTVANDVVVRDEPPAPLAYAPGSTTVDGHPEPDIDGDPPLSHGVAGFGLDLGNVEPGAEISIAYDATADEPVSDIASLVPAGEVSSRELPVPIEANADPVLSPDVLADAIAQIDGVAAADVLEAVDLPVGSLAAGGRAVDQPVRLFAFDEGYLAHYPSIRIVDGALPGEGALVSVEAARALDLARGDTIEIRVPGRNQPLALPVAGVVDLARATPLFASRKAHKLEEFLYVPDALVVSPTTFHDEIVPGFERERSNIGLVTRSFPVSEVDVQIDRSVLASDPATATRQTATVAAAIDPLAPDQGYTIDNISNALSVAAGDAAAGRRMFLFLGLPGALLAGCLAAYAGEVLAAAERRERATLRLRGARRRHLRTIALVKAIVVAAVGSVVGVALGLASAAAVLGTDAVSAAAPSQLARSAGLAAAMGLVVTAIALFLPSRRSLRRTVVDERRELRTARRPGWRRWGIDVVLLLAALIVEWAAIRRGALDPPVGSVYEGVAVTLPTGLMPAPILVWIGGVLVAVRVTYAGLRRGRSRTAAAFGPPVGGVARRGVRRRAGDLVPAAIALSLVVAFGVALALFAGTYTATKTDDSRFALGADLRITPSVLAADPVRATDASRFVVPGVEGASPVVFGLENAVLIGPTNQRRQNLGAIDPSSFGAVANVADGVAVDTTGDEMLAALAADPDGVLIDEEAADDLDVEVGDDVELILALGTNREVQDRFRVVGRFDRFPGMPEGVNLVIPVDRYRALTHIRPVDFLLAKASDASPAGLQRAVDAELAGPGTATPLHIETSATALAKDQSSLTAVNVRGLVQIDAVYAVGMSATAIGIFVFALLLQRRREYVTLRAQGLRTRKVRTLVVIEAAVVTVWGLLIGSIVGLAMAALAIGVLRGLFVLQPRIVLPVGSLALIVGVALVAAVASAVAASRMIGRLDPTEILREE